MAPTLGVEVPLLGALRLARRAIAPLATVPSLMDGLRACDADGARLDAAA